jgi:hypothetical protein
MSKKTQTINRRQLQRGDNYQRKRTRFRDDGIRNVQYFCLSFFACVPTSVDRGSRRLMINETARLELASEERMHH